MQHGQGHGSLRSRVAMLERLAVAAALTERRAQLFGRKQKPASFGPGLHDVVQVRRRNGPWLAGQWAC